MFIQFYEVIIFKFLQSIFNKGYTKSFHKKATVTDCQRLQQIVKICYRMLGFVTVTITQISIRMLNNHLHTFVARDNHILILFVSNITILKFRIVR
jgi:hypothetical protein